jgi:hypothetical protein
MSQQQQAPKKLKPSDVETYEQRNNAFEKKIKTLRDLVRFRNVPFPGSSEEQAAHDFMAYARVVQPILAETLEEFDAPNGALNPASSHPRACRVAQKLTPTEANDLLRLRDELQSHLLENLHGLARTPPLSGGDTARWSVGATMWMLVCLLNCVLRRLGLGRDKLDNFRPCTHAYLCAQLLVIDTAPLVHYSLRSLQMTLMNLVERLPTLTCYHRSLDEYVAALSLRCAELICGSGTKEEGYNAPEWCAPIALAHSGTRGVNADLSGIAEGAAGKMTCTTDFITYSMLWLTTANAWLANYHQIAAPPADSELPLPSSERYSIAQSRKMIWFPTHQMMYRTLEFFCTYAAGCGDDTYRHNLRTFAVQFEPAPSDASTYRLYQNTTQAIPSDVLAMPLPNVSAVGREFVKLIRYNLSLLEWLHRSWNWRHGETRVRSAYAGNSRQASQLAVLYVIDLFFANRARIDFRHPFVIYHNDPAFMFLCQRGKRRGYPFIAQQFGYWSVFVPHRVDPRTGTFPLDTHPESLAAMARSAAAAATAAVIFRDAPDREGGASDDDESDDELREGERGRAREAVGSSRNRPRGKRRRVDEDDDEEGDDDFDWARHLKADAQASERGDDVAVDRASIEGDAPTTDMPVPAFCRVYDCESFLDAFAVWLVALLHIRGGIVERTDLSRMICGMFGWPHPRQETVSAGVDLIL